MKLYEREIKLSQRIFLTEYKRQGKSNTLASEKHPLLLREAVATSRRFSLGLAFFLSFKLRESAIKNSIPVVFSSKEASKEACKTRKLASGKSMLVEGLTSPSRAAV
jgi:hypothetical protein